MKGQAEVWYPSDIGYAARVPADVQVGQLLAPDVWLCAHGRRMLLLRYELVKVRVREIGRETVCCAHLPCHNGLQHCINEDLRIIRFIMVDRVTRATPGKAP